MDNNTSVKDCVIIFTFQMELKKQVNLSSQLCIRTLYFLFPRPTKKLFSCKQKYMILMSPLKKFLKLLHRCGHVDIKVTMKDSVVI